MSDNHLDHMKQAVMAAKQSKGEDDRTHPLVGAVIVTKSYKAIIAHRGLASPGAHAEFSALEQIDPGGAAGATVYATLEPCTTRKHPKIPCADRLIEQRVVKVFIAMLDPNPAICGRGVRRLRKHGVDVQLFPSDLAAEVEAMNADFIRHFESMSPPDSRSQEVVSLVNPRYDADLAALDRKWRLDAILNEKSILIVTADTAIGELLDRPTAARIRDEIDRRGGTDLRRRAMLVGSAVLADARNIKNQQVLQKCPKIAVGGAEINGATDRIRKRVAELGVTEFTLPGGTGAFLNEGVPEVAIWGPSAEDTHRAAVGYISAERGLKEFLKICWG